MSHFVELQLLRAIHSLWSPSIVQVLPMEIKAAMTISDTERTSLLGEGLPKSSKTVLTFVDGSQVGLTKEAHMEPNENDIRNWLKGIRDSRYILSSQVQQRQHVLCFLDWRE